MLERSIKCERALEVLKVKNRENEKASLRDQHHFQSKD
jgi:hypothetical protein